MNAPNRPTQAIDQPSREAAIRDVVDDAHLNLAADRLAAFLLAARRLLSGADRPTGPARIAPESPAPRSPAARYLHSFEALLQGGRRSGKLSSPRRRALSAYLEDVAARPRGAGIGGMRAA